VNLVTPCRGDTLRSAGQFYQLVDSTGYHDYRCRNTVQKYLATFFIEENNKLPPGSLPEISRSVRVGARRTPGKPVSRDFVRR
jgi:hypothetical protein